VLLQGRSGKTGIATTFINSRQCSESILLDLKHLLKEAKQRVPQFLTVSSLAECACTLLPCKHVCMSSPLLGSFSLLATASLTGRQQLQQQHSSVASGCRAWLHIEHCVHCCSGSCRC
jgi:hypothetical protein